MGLAASAKALSSTDDPGNFTTAMVRNLRQNLTQQELVRELDGSSFAGEYDAEDHTLLLPFMA